MSLFPFISWTKILWKLYGDFLCAFYEDQSRFQGKANQHNEQESLASEREFSRENLRKSILNNAKPGKCLKKLTNKEGAISIPSSDDSGKKIVFCYTNKACEW